MYTVDKTLKDPQYLVLFMPNLDETNKITKLSNVAISNLICMDLTFTGSIHTESSISSLVIEDF